MKDHAHTILVIDDEEFILTSLSRLLRKDYNVLLAHNALDGLKLMQENEVHVTITDQRMPGMDGVTFSSIIKGEYPDTIRMLLTGYADLESVIGAINSSNIYHYLVKPWNPEELLSILREGCSKYDLIVENKQLTKKLMETNAVLEDRVKERTAKLSRTNAVITALNHVAYQLQTSLNLIQANTILENELNNLQLNCLIVLQENPNNEQSLIDLQLADNNGIINQYHCPTLLKTISTYKVLFDQHQGEFVSDMREWSNAVIAQHSGKLVCCVNRFENMSPSDKGIILPMYTHQGYIGALILWGENLNRDDLQTLTVFANQVAVGIENARLIESLKLLAETDGLTGVFSRRKIISLAEAEFKRAKRFNDDFSIIMIDIDKFKQVNDTFGHAMGDMVLRFVATSMQKVLRKDVDSIGRFGGDEFFVLQPKTNFAIAQSIMLRLQSSVEDGPLEMDNGPDQVSISLGIASLTAETKSLAEMLELADEKMYQFKRDRR